ncbi:MAG: hypothetical protein PHC53_00860 [Patescibacteria group bacterium]|nr:hypothetical protein [Patescibacteria group bacterium]
MLFKISSHKDKFIDRCYSKAMKELKGFFNLDWKTNRPRIILVPDRKTIDGLRGEKTPRWLVGWLKSNNIFILDRTNYEKESSHKYSNEEYAKTIKHELAHAFYLIISGHKNQPDWLWEGTAMYLAKQVKKRKAGRPNNFKEFLLYFSKSGSGVYREAGEAVRFLAEAYGKRKLLLLIKLSKDVDTKEHFAKLFRRIYGFDLKYSSFEINN